MMLGFRWCSYSIYQQGLISLC